MTDMCQVEGCKEKVTKAGHTLCLDHWKADRNKTLKHCAACNRFHENPGPLCLACSRKKSDQDDAPEPEAPRGYLSSTRIGKHFQLSSTRINLILAELGWVEKYGNGWAPTDRGNALGANVKPGKKAPFVVWPESILQSAALKESIAEQSADDQRPQRSKPSREKPSAEASDFRDRFPATIRTMDGHMVRSRAEALIDNWLYMQGIVHAYERRLPIEEECYCDFYLPGGKGVYIEFWGRSDSKYLERKAVKQTVYATHGLKLIELADMEVGRLDDVLPRMLMRFGIGCQ